MQDSKRVKASGEALSFSSLSEESIEWLSETGRSVEDVVTEARYRDEFRQEFANLLQFCATSETHRRILSELVFKEGVTYDCLVDRTGKTRRTVKGHIGTLCEMGIVETTRSSMVVIALTDSRLKLVLGEVLTLHRLATE